MSCGRENNEIYPADKQLSYLFHLLLCCLLLSGDDLSAYDRDGICRLTDDPCRGFCIDLRNDLIPERNLPFRECHCQEAEKGNRRTEQNQEPFLFQYES